MTGEFVWHDLTTSDVERAQRFYTELLGWGVEVWRPGEADYPMIAAGGAFHGGFGPALEGGPSLWVGHVAVDDADAAGARAERAGGTVLGALDMGDVGQVAIVRDPQGALLSAFQSARGMDAPEGVFDWDELSTSDVAAAATFYGELFGWTAHEMTMGERGSYTVFRAGERDVAGCLALPPGSEAPAHWLPYLHADDVDGATRRAEELGGIVCVEPTDIPQVGRFSVAEDPTGAMFGVYRAGQS